MQPAGALLQSTGMNGERPEQPAGDSFQRTDSPTVRLQLLGSFAAYVDGAIVALPVGVQRLLTFLALHDRPLRRGTVAGSLWPEASEERAGANLRTTLWRCRGLQQEAVEADAALRLLPSVRIDLRETAAGCRWLIEEDGTDGVAVGDLCCDLLPDWDEDWILLERERFRQLRLHALEVLCHRLSMAGRHAEAVEAGLACVAGEPLRETAQAVLIRAHLAEGNPNEAIRQYCAYEVMLDRELGLAPSRALTDLISGSPARS